jgi:two-component system OmpR family response regulator
MAGGGPARNVVASTNTTSECHKRGPLCLNICAAFRCVIGATRGCQLVVRRATTAGLSSTAEIFLAVIASRCIISAPPLDVTIPAADCGWGRGANMAMHRPDVANCGVLSAESDLSKRIAIVEDEAAIRENYAAAFRREGYSVDLYDARRPAMDAFDARLPDLVVIDVNLKNEVEGGFELCRDLRSKAAELPIIFLTARDSEFDAVSGLRLGADDYLTKDISIPHLMARVAALFRRLEAMQQPQQKSSRMTRGDLELDVDRMTVRWKDQSVGLTLTEFWIVHSLARYPGHVRNRQQLMDAARAVLDDNTITSHIKRIRRKFIAIDPAFDAVETVYGMGYRWLGE